MITYMTCVEHIQLNNDVFLPRTWFQRPSGQSLTAWDLKSQGGDVVMGPDGAGVTVLRATCLQAEKRDTATFGLLSEGTRFTFVCLSFVFGLLLSNR